MNLDKMMEFIFYLYDMKYEPSLNTRINGLLTRTFSGGDEDDKPIEVRRAEKLFRKLSASAACFPLRDNMSLTWGDLGRFKDLLQQFALDIVEKISEGVNDPYCLARSSFRFVQRWNDLVNEMNGKFIRGFGSVCAEELSILNSSPHILISILVKLRKARNVPRELNCFHHKKNQKAITKSIDAYAALRNSIKSRRIGNM